MHRAELARQLQTSRATITNTVTTLLEQGLIEPEGLAAGTTAGDGKAPPGRSWCWPAGPASSAP